MDAIYLVGGKGTRLRPLTYATIKPMVPIMNKPLLERKLERAAKFGIRHAFLSSCYKSDSVKTYFQHYTMRRISLFEKKESFPLGTGGAIRNAAEGLTNDFFVFNADILESIDLSKMARCHRKMHADVTIAVKKMDDVSSFGVIEEKDGYAVKFIEKPQKGETLSHLINAGVYLFSPNVVSTIPQGQFVSVERDIFPLLLQQGRKIALYPIRSYWCDIGNPFSYLKVHYDIMKGLYRIPEIDYRNEQIYVHGLSLGYLKNQLQGPVYIGNHVKIGQGAVIGPYACIGDNCSIPRGCHIRQSLLWKNVHLKPNEVVDGSIVTPFCRLNNLTALSRDTSSHPVATFLHMN